ncbi:molybdopterin converting factor subunit 1 [Peribacillus sp. SCS-155]|uniref:molybdopterin converting factor subunit 1 n=1 Tax=Peribacillus sedimenti TaxID=3115297 RepID=UPI0039066A9F
MIKVLFFAQLKDDAGVEEAAVAANDWTVAQLKEHISSNFGVNGLTSVMTAVNEEFADDETMLSDGDTVAFIPPVSGG